MNTLIEQKSDIISLFNTIITTFTDSLIDRYVIDFERHSFKLFLKKDIENPFLFGSISII
jgi:hypothetical protein